MGGYKSTSILEMTASGRRLLEEHSSQLSLQVRFLVQGKHREPSAQETFKKALQSNLNTIVPGVTIDAVSAVEWSSPTSTERNGDNNEDKWMVYLAAISASLVALGMGSFCVWKCRHRVAITKKQTLEAEQTAVKPAEDIIIDGLPAPDDKDVEKAEKVDHIETASTCTPTSEPPASLDGTNSESNSKDADEVQT